MELHDSRQLLAQGWSKQQLRRGIESGGLAKVRRGMYLTEPSDDAVLRHRAALEATRRAVPGQWWFSHQSAALLHGLPTLDDQLAQVQLTRDRTGGAGETADLKRWCCPLPSGQRTTVDGHPVTTVARTIVDLARGTDGPWSVAVADAALRRGLTTSDEVAAVLAVSPRRPGNGIAKARLEMADPLSESPGESISRVNMALAGLPMPELQHEFVLRDGSLVRVDFWWPDFQLVGEFDGLLKYAGDAPGGLVRPEVLVREKAREDGLRQLGLFVVRWGWRVALNRPLLAATIRGAMSRASQSRAA